MINSHRRFGAVCCLHLQGLAVKDKELQGMPQSGLTTEVCLARPQAVTAMVTLTRGAWNDTVSPSRLRHYDRLKRVDSVTPQNI